MDNFKRNIQSYGHSAPESGRKTYTKSVFYRVLSSSPSFLTYSWKHQSAAVGTARPWVPSSGWAPLFPFTAIWPTWHFYSENETILTLEIHTCQTNKTKPSRWGLSARSVPSALQCSLMHRTPSWLHTVCKNQVLAPAPATKVLYVISLRTCAG